MNFQIDLKSRNAQLALLARAFIACLFFVAGIRKLLAWTGTIAYFSKVGVPVPDIAIFAVVAVELIGSILFVIGWKPKLVGSILAIFTLLTAFFGHPFWSVDAAQFGNQLNHFLKNVAIFGGIMLAVLAAPKST